MTDHKPKLIPVQEALDKLLSRISPLQGGEDVPVVEALGRVLAQAQMAGMDVPAHDNSAMDGYALRLADLAGEELCLPVSQSIAAGHPGQPLAPGSAARIFTGAALPAGADAVVIQEDARAENGRVRILQKPSPGENIRPRGHDIRQGDRVLEAGHPLRAQDLGLLASLGIGAIRVRPRLRVAIVNTGDEVVPPGRQLGPGQIYDSNSHTLSGLLQGLGCEVIRLGIVEDSLARTREALEEAAARADCIVTTGGVSVGDEDHVRAAVESLGELFLWKLAIKPGKPFSHGHVKGLPLFGLPGNPVAVFVTFAILVRPCLLKMLGAAALEPPGYPVPAGFSRSRPAGRQEYIRVRLARKGKGAPVLEPFPDQGSSILTSLSWADGLAVLPPGLGVAEGDPVHYLPFSGLLNL